MLVSLENVSLSFGENLILSNVCVNVDDHDRIGIIGANGIGKSTLLNLISGELLPDRDNERENQLYVTQSLGFLKQNSGLDGNNTIYEEMESVFSDLLDIKKRFESTQDIDEYDKLHNLFIANDGYNIDVKIKTILNGMGFTNYDMIISPLSGGEKTRLALAKLLLKAPQLLILDEPTNHLDFKTLMWLEDYLASYKGGLLIVSHDRYFLDKTVTKIWDVENKKVIAYNAGYSKYKVLKEEKYKSDLKAYQAQQNKINSMIDYAKRNIVRASTSNMAKSRLHQLENIETLEKPVLRTPTPFFKFEFERNPVKDILKVENLKLQAGEKLLCENITFDMQRGDKIALIGPNGIGKTTLLKKLKEFSWGANVKLSYYDQEGKNLNFDNTAMDEVWNRFPKLTPYEVRSILGQVLISGEDVFKKIGVMSGGERARVAFAIMMKEQGNVLLLDEPTNHLDLQSKEELERSLNEFQGSLIIVSHDRYFLNAIPNKIVELSENGLEIYKGNFDFYLEQQKKQELSLKQSEVIVKKNPEVKTEYRSKEQRKQEVKLKQKIKEIEEQIVFNEQEIARLQEDIENNASDYEKISVLCQQLEAIKKENDLLLEELVLLSE